MGAPQSAHTCQSGRVCITVSNFRRREEGLEVVCYTRASRVSDFISRYTCCPSESDDAAIEAVAPPVDTTMRVTLVA